MAQPLLEFGEVNLSVAAGGRSGERAGRVAELTFEYLRDLMHRELQHLAADVEIGHIEVGPLDVSFERMSDEEIARRSATEIHRALLNALGQ